MSVLWRAVEFNSTAQKMKCPYCDTEFEIETLKKYDEELEAGKAKKEDQMQWQEDAGSQWGEEETSKMRVYHCESCGGEIIADENQAATKCPYCDNPVVMKGQFQGDLRPDYVIPFKLDKAAAKERFKSHLNGKPLLPKVFRSENHIDEIKGIYVPFWLFDADAEADIRYKGTTVRTWVIRIIIIPRPVTILFYEGDGSGLNGFRWMVLPRWKMI